MTDIKFLGMEPSAAVEHAVAEWMEKLTKTNPRITRAAVTIEQPHKSHHQGNTFKVRVEIAVPEHTVIADRDPGRDHAHEDVYVALADAFTAARRQLDHYRTMT